MKRQLDISIGQRLFLGFGFLLGIFAALVAAAAVWHLRMAEEQETFATRIAPLNNQADALERAVLHVAIAVRSFLASPDGEALKRYHESVGKARDSLRRLGEIRKEPDGENLYRKLVPLLDHYLSEADHVIAERRTGPVSIERDLDLSRVRELALDPLREFTRLQAEKTAQALGRMTAAQADLSSGLALATTLAAVSFVALAFFTARSVRVPARKLLKVASAMEAGNLEPALALTRDDDGGPFPRAQRNEMLQVARAFGATAVALDLRERHLRAVARLAGVLTSSLDRETVANAALPRIVEHARAEVGVLYWFDPTMEALHPIARHALNGHVDMLKIGEGIPGQAARDRHMLVVGDIPKETPFSIKFGFDQTPPKNIAALPIIAGEELHGVLLVASLHDFDSDALTLLETAASQLGVGFQNLRAHAETQQLLSAVREKNEQIQAQNEELQAQNEEIQAQSEEIQAQSEQLQAQHEEIQAQNDELKVQSEELRMQASILTEADERKNEFLGILAHELRNPMAPITNSLFVLKRAAPGSDQALRAQAVIERQTHHLSRLIDDLLDITRISRGKIQIQSEPVDLVEIMRTCIDDIQPAVAQKDLVLQIALPDTEMWVEGDRTRLSQIVGNLLNNAVKFTDRGSRIELALRPDRENDRVALHVIDDGIGIDADLLPNLFQPFTQGTNTLARTNGGLGLGLALVKALAQLHGGSVEACSDGLARGAEFIVHLPLMALRGGEKPIGEPTEKEACRILVIEDHADAAQSLREAMELEGHVVRLAHSGAEGIAAALVFKPHVVLCDIGLPQMDGYEVARRFRTHPRLHSATLVALTGYAADGDKARAVEAGFHHHLPKPPDIGRLLQILAGANAEQTSGGSQPRAE